MSIYRVLQDYVCEGALTKKLSTDLTESLKDIS